MASIYKQKASPAAKSDLAARRQLFEQRGQQDNHVASITNPAYCIISGGEVQIPNDKQIEFGDVYGEFKHDPILESVNVSIEGNGFILKSEINIKCFTKDDFDVIQETFCAPQKEITIRFGYSNPFSNDGYNSQGKIESMRIVGYEFNYESENVYGIKLQAMAPGEGIKALDVVVDIETRNLTFQLAGIHGTEETEVTGINELIMYHAQGQGKKLLSQAPVQKPIEISDDWAEGHIIVYDISDLSNNKTLIGSWFGTSEYVVYCSLKYIVSFINKSIKRAYIKRVPDSQKDVLRECEIKFHKNYSKMFVPRGTRSSRPTDILILGGDEEAGNYSSVFNQTFFQWRVYKREVGMSFDIEEKDYHTFTEKAEGNFREIDLENIYVSQYIIERAFSNSEFDWPDDIELDEDDHKEENISVDEFFRYIFKQISRSTGGIIQLRLSQDPHTIDNKDKGTKLYITAENEAHTLETFDVIMFDPVKGDGLLRTHTIQSAAGSNDYKANMFATRDSGVVASNNEEGGDDFLGPVGPQQNQDSVPLFLPYIESKMSFSISVAKIRKFCNEDTKLHKSNFSETQMTELNSLIAELIKPYDIDERKKFAKMVWPGMELNVELDGIWGIIPGCGMYSSILDKTIYFNTGRYFAVENVNHSFTGDNSQWVTSLSGKLWMTDPQQFKEI